MNLRSIYTFMLAGALVAVGQPAFAEIEAPQVYDAPMQPAGISYVPQEVVVKYKNDTARFRVLNVPDVEQALKALGSNPNIEYVEPNFVAHAAAVPNDPLYAPYQWHFDNDEYGGVHAESAWDTTAGVGTIVAVIDTGIAYEDYSTGRGRIKESYSQAPDLATTCFVQGHDFINNDAHPNDDHSHGTHVAGTIAQSTNNSTGVAGLAHETCLMPIKALSQSGSGSYTAIANAIYYAADNGADVINMSLGGSGDSETLRNAVAYAYNNGVTIVAAAGNSGDTSDHYPAAYDQYVISVGATRYDETLTRYSSYGTHQDIVAPGGDTSIDQNGDGYPDGVLQQTLNPTTKNVHDFGYYFFQGTSMATPHVAAAAAMVIANGGATSPDDVRTALESTTDDLGAPGRDDIFGHGLLNIPAALSWTSGPIDEAPTVTLDTPVDGAVVAGDVILTASASDDNGVTEVRFAIDGTVVFTDTTAPYEFTWSTSSTTDGTYTVSATASDTIGQEAGDSVSITVDNVNDAPVADAGGDQSVTDADGSGDELVTLDGSGSYDPDPSGSISTYEWYEGATLIATGGTPDVVLTLGTHILTLTVTDNSGAVDSDAVTITVAESAEEQCPPGWAKKGICTP